MAVDLNLKVARLIADFRSTLALIDFIQHELEKRIVARLGLIKIEALISLAGTYKNEVKRSLGPSGAAAVQALEVLLAQLRKDVDGGVRSVRNALVGHSLALNLREIPENWLFLGHSTFTILSQDLDRIDDEFAKLDPAYVKATQPSPLDPALLTFWSAPNVLGPVGAARVVTMPTGLWTPDVVAPVPGGTKLQDASIRVLGLRLSIRQAGLLFLPFWAIGGTVSTYERLLLELTVVDFFALEEAIYTGNVRGGTSSLVDEWASESPMHAGVAILSSMRAHASPSLSLWRDQVRNKICAHLDPDIPAADLEVDKWPMVVSDFNAEIERLCQLLGTAARQDVRTMIFVAPATPIKNGVVPPRVGAPTWNQT
ncbi:hypothetical protein [Bradyrhizobium sp. AZCC 2230]|uniref:hypothetical protein n=1 Tax=Bradyrhizobium sp. AZCC 2230 TaxID=3117021 RepID=UPI002FF1EF70